MCSCRKILYAWWWWMRRGLPSSVCTGLGRICGEVGWRMFVCFSGCFCTYFVCVYHSFLDPQPVYDVCRLPSCQGIHCGQDSTCSGQDLWLLRTRCASDEYFKYSSLKSYRAGKLSNSPWFMKCLLFLWKWEFSFLSLWPSYGECHHFFVCVDVWTCRCGSVLVMQPSRPPGSTTSAKAVR